MAAAPTRRRAANPTGPGCGIVRQRRLRHVRNLQPHGAATCPSSARSASPSAIPPASARRSRVKAAADPRVRRRLRAVLYGPHDRRRSRRFAPGRVSAEAGRAAYDAIVRAVATRRRGAIDAIATAPVNKEAFALAGLPWKGHTDLLAHLTGTPRVAMMFYAEALRVVLATVHVPLADVPRAADA